MGFNLLLPVFWLRERNGSVGIAAFTKKKSGSLGFPSVPRFYTDSDGAVYCNTAVRFPAVLGFWYVDGTDFGSSRYKYRKPTGTFLGGNTIRPCSFQRFPVFLFWRYQLWQFPVYHIKSGGTYSAVMKYSGVFLRRFSFVVSWRYRLYRFPVKLKKLSG